MPRLRAIAERERLADGVRFHGWVEHAQIQRHFAESDLLVFPSIREFGGGVVLEAMATGLVPVVVAYGGPKELVDEGCGFGIPMASRESIISQIRSVLERLVREPHRVDQMSEAAVRRARGLFTWEAKARQVPAVYDCAQPLRRNPISGCRRLLVRPSPRPSDAWSMNGKYGTQGTSGRRSRGPCCGPPFVR
jgi:glycosyltransferase involved in cell wall biosynthesis